MLVSPNIAAMWHDSHCVTNYRQIRLTEKKNKQHQWPFMGESTGDLWLHTRNQSRWRHQIETFSALLTLCAGNSPAIGEFPAQRPVTWSFDVFFVLSLNKRLSKQSWGWWFETPPRPLWRHCNEWCRMCFLYTSSSMVWWKYPLLSKQTHNVINTYIIIAWNILSKD